MLTPHGVHAQSPGHILLFAIPWTITHWDPLFHGVSQARILEWVAISFSSGWIFLTQGSNPHLLHWQVDSLSLTHQEVPTQHGYKSKISPQFGHVVQRQTVSRMGTWLVVRRCRFNSASMTLTCDFSNTKHKYCLSVYCVPNLYQTLSICLLISSFPIRQDSLSSLYIQEDWGSRDRSSSPSSRAGIQIHLCLPRSFHCNTHVLWTSVSLSVNWECSIHSVQLRG